MKTCFKCGETKPYSEYYKHPKMGDGYLGKCKTCTKADVAARVESKQSDPEWVVAEAKRCCNKANKYRAEGRYISTPQARKMALAKHKERYPEKTFARNAVNNAVRDGTLQKKDCGVCGSADSEAHHEDYSKPLDVIWFCPKHHAERHVQIRDEQRRKRANERRAAVA